jgi:hypothetical protein
LGDLAGVTQRLGTIDGELVSAGTDLAQLTGREATSDTPAPPNTGEPDAIPVPQRPATTA